MIKIPKLINNITQLQIFKNLWFNSFSTIPKLSEELGIDRSNISRNLRHLLKYELVKSRDEKEATNNIGRKANIIELNEKKGYNIGIVVTENLVASFLTDLRLNIIKQNRIEERIDYNNLLTFLEKCIDPFKNFFEKTLCISIAFPGAVNTKEGELFYSRPIPLNQTENIRNKIQKKFDMPVYLENDANAGAMYYLLKNKYKYPNIVYSLFAIHFNENKVLGYLGNGIVINKQLYEGSNFFAGKIYQDTMEVLRINKKIFNVQQLKEYFSQRENLEEDLCNFIEELSNKMSYVINLYDPAAYILGGYIKVFPKKIQKLLLQKLQEKIVDFEERNHQFFIDESLLKSSAIGASASLINKIFTDPNIANKYLSKII